MTLLLLTLVGCNKGRALIETATEQHLNGDMAKALVTLGRVATEAPGTPEVPGSVFLAVDWLLSAADKTEAPNDRIDLAERALKWDPQNGLAQVVICEAYAKQGNAERLRECLGSGLQGKLNLPQARLQQVRALDRAQLVEQGTKDGWSTLASLYPNTPEGERASEELRRTASVCYGLPEMKERLLHAIRGIDNEMSQLKTRLGGRTATAYEMLAVIDKYKFYFRGASAKMQQATRDIDTHDILAGEKAIRTLLVDLCRAVARTQEAYALAFEKGIMAIGFLASKHPEFYRPLLSAGEHSLTAAEIRCRELRPKNTDSVAHSSPDSSVTASVKPESVLDVWLRSQNSQDFDTYSRLYAPDFIGVKRSDETRKEYALPGWLEDRRGMFANHFTVKVSDQRVENRPDGTIAIRFKQEWASAKFADIGNKELVLKGGADGLRIIREEQLDSKVSTLDKDSTAPSSHDEPTTQWEINIKAGTNTMKAEKQMREAYDDLRRSLAAQPDALAKLDLAQTTWLAYTRAHELERFPQHLEDPMFYGSFFPTCLAGEREGAALTRVRDLRRKSPCEGNSTANQVQTASQAAELALNETYRKVRSAYADDSTFLAAFRLAQRAWLKFRDAQVAFAEASGGANNPMCGTSEFDHVDRARTKEMLEWLNPPEEGDMCQGSFGPPR